MTSAATAGGDHAARLARLRARLAERDVDGLIFPRTDEHGSEYLPANAERMAWLTGFTGSWGQVVVLRDKAAVFTDGRYTVQTAQQVDEALFERRHLVEEPPPKWLEANLLEGGRLGYDPFLTKAGERDRLAKAIAGRGGLLVPLTPDPVDEVWADRPAPPQGRVEALDERYAGEASAAKRARMGDAVAAKGADWLLLTAPDSIAWLLNVRGADIPFNPVCLSFAILGADATCRWFVDPGKLPPEGLDLGNGVAPEPADGLLDALDALGGTGAKVLVDPGEAHLGFVERLRAAGAKVVEAENPVVLAKACKNPTEVAGAVDAQRRDGAAVARFLAWLDAQPRDGTLDEMGAAERLLAERAKDPLFRGSSFDTISAHGPNAALPHYHSTPASNRPLTGGSLYLVDSGGQYPDATTDITRTVALGEPTPEMRQRFTLVLKGHVAVASALFPEGTTGAQLDTLARYHLWQRGLDFDHGTGHGVGAYLSVHEGPARISKLGGVPLKPGMILSDEPGYYKPGEYGIRTENLLVVEPREAPEGADKPLLGFRTLTLCPFDRRLIDVGLLTAEERAWVDAYHARVLEELTPLVGDVGEWLAEACAPL